MTPFSMGVCRIIPAFYIKTFFQKQRYGIFNKRAYRGTGKKTKRRIGLETRAYQINGNAADRVARNKRPLKKTLVYKFLSDNGFLYGFKRPAGKT